MLIQRDPDVMCCSMRYRSIATSTGYSQQKGTQYDTVNSLYHLIISYHFLFEDINQVLAARWASGVPFASISQIGSSDQVGSRESSMEKLRTCVFLES